MGMAVPVIVVLTGDALLVLHSVDNSLAWIDESVWFTDILK
jgi:hypothetical protein